jgi:hypothetical protein
MPHPVPSPISAISPDEAFGARLAAALAGVGDVVTASPETAPADAVLHVVHVVGEPELPPGDGRVLAILPRSNLEAIVRLMRASDRVAGMLIEDALDHRELAAMARRIVTGELFGLAKVMPAGTEIHTRTVRDAHERSTCISKILELAHAARVPRRHQAAIEQCCDEMLINALYDAPVDNAGAPVFAGIPIRERLRLKIDQTIVVQYACDGTHFAMSVRDAFGSLTRTTVLGVLHKCLHFLQKVDRKAGGAGVGLYLMVSSAAAVYFHVVPGVATEAVCVFELGAARQQLARFGFFEEPRDVTGTLASGRRPAEQLRPTALVRPEARRRRIAIALAVVALAGVGAVVAHRMLRTPPPPPIVTIDSQPTGARVMIDGRDMGDAPLVVSSLDPGSTVTVSFEHPGHEPASQTLEVPGAGERSELVQPLVLSPKFVRVRFVSRPPGARIVAVDAPATADRRYTPAELFLEVGRIQRFVLVMPGHVPHAIEPFTPAPQSGAIEQVGELVPGATLRIEGAGKVTVAGAPHCQAMAAPVDCTLAPGSYEVELVTAEGARIARVVELGDVDTTVRLDR